MSFSIFKNSKYKSKKDDSIATPMNPRIKNRRQEVIKRKKMIRRRIIFLFLILLGSVVLVTSVFYSPWFRLNKIQVHSPRSQQVKTILASDPFLKNHPLLINISSQEISSRLENMSWVKSVKVVKSWPSDLQVWVKPRIVLAKVKVGKTSWALVDQKGRIISISKNPSSSLISLGATLSSASDGEFISPKFIPLLDLVSKFPSSFHQSFSSIYFGTSGGVRLQLAHPKITVIFGTPTQVTSKFISLETILKKVPLAGVSAIDVSVAQRPTLTRG